MFGLDSHSITPRLLFQHLLTVASDLQAHQLSTSQKIAEVKRKQIELNLRILKVLLVIMPVPYHLFATFKCTVLGILFLAVVR